MAQAEANWLAPNLKEFESLVPSSVCWDCQTFEDDIYEMPKHSNIANDLNTKTSEEQQNTEEICGYEIKKWLLKTDISASAVLKRRRTIEYLLNGLKSLPPSLSSLDCSRSWICYWIINSLNLLNADIFLSNELKTNTINFINQCQNMKDKNDGGFGGGPYQYSHAAASFGAIMALISIGNNQAYNAINRKQFYHFILSLKKFDGSFSVHIGGEIDIRAVYCLLSTASILNILNKKMIKNCIKWICDCQRYEGGFSQEPMDEAHGGYAYCAIASLIIIKRQYPKIFYDEIVKNKFNINTLIRWLSFKQMQFSGGFNGRTNKLVDACYSFWIGSCFDMINILKDDNNNNNNNNNVLFTFHSLQLQKYLLICCQPSNRGGIADKPPKSSDYYHTCYGLMGLSIAQHFNTNNILGPKSNLLEEIDSIYGIAKDKLKLAVDYFKKLPPVESD